MLKQTSREFRKLFLLQFTKELINAYAPEDILKLEKILKKENKEGSTIKKESRELIKDILKEKEKKLELLQREELPEKKQALDIKKNFASLKKTRPVLRIPETRLPQTFQYLKPTPTKKEIELGKLNILIQDPLIKVIECNGPDENIIVHGSIGTKPTRITLSKQEIDEIIDAFSKTAKIPKDEGIFKAVAGNLILSAIISDIIGSKFIIKKMMYAPKYY